MASLPYLTGRVGSAMGLMTGAADVPAGAAADGDTPAVDTTPKEEAGTASFIKSARLFYFFLIFRASTSFLRIKYTNR